MARIAVASFSRARFIKVLLTASSVLVAYTFGASLDSIFNIGGVITNVVWQLALIWSLCAKEQLGKRIWGFSAAALFLRVSLNPASISPGFNVNQGYVFGISVGSAAHFVYFSVRPISPSRKVYLYVGTLISSTFAVLNWMEYASSKALLIYKLHFGLVLLTWLLVLATQEIKERYANGEEDYFLNAMVMIQVIFQYCFCNAVVLLKKEVKGGQ